jgi:hypothetical protein
VNETEAASATKGEALIERVVASTIGLFDLAGVYLGLRLGLYQGLHLARRAELDAARDHEQAGPRRRRRGAPVSRGWMMRACVSIPS